MEANNSERVSDDLLQVGEAAANAEGGLAGGSDWNFIQG